jgi:hypothetical protein
VCHGSWLCQFPIHPSIRPSQHRAVVHIPSRQTDADPDRLQHKASVGTPLAASKGHIKRSARRRSGTTASRVVGEESYWPQEAPERISIERIRQESEQHFLQHTSFGPEQTDINFNNRQNHTLCSVVASLNEIRAPAPCTRALLLAHQP